MHSIVRIIKFALQGVARNFWLSIVTVTMMLMALFSVTLLLGIDYIKQATIKGMEQKVDILISLKPNIDKARLDILYDDLKYLPEVQKVTIITPEENKALFEKNNADSRVRKALEVFDANENPFSYSLAVNAYNLDQYQKILDFVKQDKYQDLVEDSAFRDYESFVNKIDNISKAVNRYSWYIILIFLLISVVVIFNTIRMSIYTRRDEIVIMRLVGASSWFVRAPFLLESILYALAATLILVGVVYSVVNLLQPSLNTYFQGEAVINLLQYFQSNFWFIFGGEFIVLVFLNIVSTALAIRKYLKV
ncbi:MAG: permease-like cell division protein FtsX [Patescibacteria group bacterium]